MNGFMKVGCAVFASIAAVLVLAGGCGNSSSMTSGGTGGAGGERTGTGGSAGSGSRGSGVAGGAGGSPSDAGCKGGIELSVFNFERRCYFSLSGGDPLDVAELKACLIPLPDSGFFDSGAETGGLLLNAEPKAGFEIGPAPWTGTATDSVTQYAATASVVLKAPSTCVSLCCPFIDGGGCPITSPCDDGGLPFDAGTCPEPDAATVQHDAAAFAKTFKCTLYRSPSTVPPTGATFYLPGNGTVEHCPLCAPVGEVCSSIKTGGYNPPLSSDPPASGCIYRGSFGDNDRNNPLASAWCCP